MDFGSGLKYLEITCCAFFFLGILNKIYGMGTTGLLIVLFWFGAFFVCLFLVNYYYFHNNKITKEPYYYPGP